MNVNAPHDAVMVAHAADRGQVTVTGPKYTGPAVLIAWRPWRTTEQRGRHRTFTARIARPDGPRMTLALNSHTVEATT